MSRSTADVQREYAIDARADYWKKDPTFDELVYGDDRTLRWIVDDGVLRVGTARAARHVLLGRLLERVQEMGQAPVVAEFGCGTGRNLFYLKSKLPEARLIGFELTESTVENARRNSKRFGLNVEFHVADMTSRVPCDDSTADLSYSIHALEQLPSQFPAAVAQMSRLTKSRLLFLEPVHELFPQSITGLAARLRLRNANYLDGLLAHLNGLSTGRVRQAQAMSTVGAPLNHTCEIVFDLYR